MKINTCKIMRACHQTTCMNPVFSHGYCKNHQYLRMDSKYLKKQAERKFKQFHPVKKVAHNTNFGFRSESEMFYKIWDESSHVCAFTGKDLSSYVLRSDGLWFSCFAHILPKGRFPLFKLNADNIRIVNPEFHTIIDQGTAEDRLKHPEWDFVTWDKLVIKMKDKYMKFQKDNLL